MRWSGLRRPGAVGSWGRSGESGDNRALTRATQLPSDCWHRPTTVLGYPLHHVLQECAAVEGGAPTACTGQRPCSIRSHH